MSTKTPLPTVNEKATESVSIKGLFVGRVFSKLAQLLRHCMWLTVKVHPEGSLVLLGVLPPIWCGLVAFCAACKRCSFTLGVPLCWWVANKRIISVKRAISLFMADSLAYFWTTLLGFDCAFYATAGNWDKLTIFRPYRRRHNYRTLLILAGNREIASASPLARHPVTQEFWPFGVPNMDFVAPASPWHTEHPVCPSCVKVAKVQQRCNFSPPFKIKVLRVHLV